MRGQAATEYLLIFVVMLITVATLTSTQLIDPSREASRDISLLSQARLASDIIAEAMNTVYGNGSGAVRSVLVSLEHRWDLLLTRNPPEVKVSIGISDRTENVGSAVEYAFDASLRSIPAGTYTVIVEWTEEENLVQEGQRIYIRIKPGDA